MAFWLVNGLMKTNLQTKGLIVANVHWGSKLNFQSNSKASEWVSRCLSMTKNEQNSENITYNVYKFTYNFVHLVFDNYTIRVLQLDMTYQCAERRPRYIFLYVLSLG